LQSYKKENTFDLTEFKRQRLNLFFRLLHPFKTRNLTQKIKRLPKHFITYFDQESYLSVNPDIKDALSKKMYKTPLEHFILFGYNEVKEGKRQIGKEFPLLNEREYLSNNPDIQKACENGEFLSFFDHFMHFGYEEFLRGERVITDDRSIEEAGIYKYRIPSLTDSIRQNIKVLQYQPLISVVMPVYNIDRKWLKLAIDSLHKQWYDNWELCIADDASTKEETLEYLKTLENPKIKIIFLKENVNISAASNVALGLAAGDYIALMDHDDELAEDAFYEVVKAINRTKADFFYSDEDKIEEDGTFCDPHFKPDFAPDMFLAQNYLSHLAVIKKELVKKVGGWEVGLEGSQDYDLYLKILEHTDKIHHIPKVLYHWRKIPGSTSAEYSDKSYAQEAGRKALENAMQRRDISANVQKGKYPGTYKIEYALKGEPLISIIVPFKDKPELLKMSIESVLNKSTYSHFEIIGISNHSEKKETFEEMKRLEKLDERISFYEYNIPFNYSKINNYAVQNYAKGKHIVLMNNDIEIITPNWIEEMLMFSQREDVGAVGAKLYYPDDTIQHAGVIMGIGGVAGHSHKYFDQDAIGYFSRLHIVQNFSAVTAACLMIKKDIYVSVGGLNENDLKVAFNDVDFCLRLRESGYLNIFTPYAEAYHHESLSRGEDNSGLKIMRFQEETNYMLSRHQKILKMGDPYYNVNLTLKNENFKYINKATK